MDSERDENLPPAAENTTKTSGVLSLFPGLKSMLIPSLRMSLSPSSRQSGAVGVTDGTSSSPTRSVLRDFNSSLSSFKPESSPKPINDMSGVGSGPAKEESETVVKKIVSDVVLTVPDESGTKHRVSGISEISENSFETAVGGDPVGHLPDLLQSGNSLQSGFESDTDTSAVYESAGEDERVSPEHPESPYTLYRESSYSALYDTPRADATHVLDSSAESGSTISASSFACVDCPPDLKKVPKLNPALSHLRPDLNLSNLANNFHNLYLQTPAKPKSQEPLLSANNSVVELLGNTESEWLDSDVEIISHCEGRPSDPLIVYEGRSSPRDSAVLSHGPGGRPSVYEVPPDEDEVKVFVESEIAQSSQTEQVPDRVQLTEDLPQRETDHIKDVPSAAETAQENSQVEPDVINLDELKVEPDVINLVDEPQVESTAEERRTIKEDSISAEVCDVASALAEVSLTGIVNQSKETVCESTGNVSSVCSIPVEVEATSGVNVADPASFVVDNQEDCVTSFDVVQDTSASKVTSENIVLAAEENPAPVVETQSPVSELPDPVRTDESELHPSPKLAKSETPDGCSVSVVVECESVSTSFSETQEEVSQVLLTEVRGALPTEGTAKERVLPEPSEVNLPISFSEEVQIIPEAVSVEKTAERPLTTVPTEQSEEVEKEVSQAVRSEVRGAFEGTAKERVLPEPSEVNLPISFSEVQIIPEAVPVEDTAEGSLPAVPTEEISREVEVSQALPTEFRGALSTEGTAKEQALPEPSEVNLPTLTPEEVAQIIWEAVPVEKTAEGSLPAVPTEQSKEVGKVSPAVPSEVRGALPTEGTAKEQALPEPNAVNLPILTPGEVVQIIPETLLVQKTAEGLLPAVPTEEIKREVEKEISQALSSEFRGALPPEGTAKEQALPEPNQVNLPSFTRKEVAQIVREAVPVEKTAEGPVPAVPTEEIKREVEKEVSQALPAELRGALQTGRTAKEQVLTESTEVNLPILTPKEAVIIIPEAVPVEETAKGLFPAVSTEDIKGEVDLSVEIIKEVSHTGQTAKEKDSAAEPIPEETKEISAAEPTNDQVHASIDPEDSIRTIPSRQIAQKEVFETEQAEKAPETVQAEEAPETVQGEKASETVQGEKASETVQGEKASETVQAEKASEIVQAGKASEIVQAGKASEIVQPVKAPEIVQPEEAPETVQAEVAKEEGYEILPADKIVKDFSDVAPREEANEEVVSAVTPEEPAVSTVFAGFSSAKYDLNSEISLNSDVVQDDFRGYKAALDETIVSAEADKVDIAALRQTPRIAALKGKKTSAGDFEPRNSPVFATGVSFTSTPVENELIEKYNDTVYLDDSIDGAQLDVTTTGSNSGEPHNAESLEKPLDLSRGSEEPIDLSCAQSGLNVTRTLDLNADISPKSKPASNLDRTFDVGAFGEPDFHSTFVKHDQNSDKCLDRTFALPTVLTNATFVNKPSPPKVQPYVSSPAQVASVVEANSTFVCNPSPPKTQPCVLSPAPAAPVIQAASKVNSLSSLIAVCAQQEKDLREEDDVIHGEKEPSPDFDFLSAEAAKVTEEISLSFQEIDQKNRTVIMAGNLDENPFAARAKVAVSPPLGRRTDSRIFSIESKVNTINLNVSEAGPETAGEHFKSEEIFRDPATFDFLSQLGSSSTRRELAKESLYVKFDPLVGFTSSTISDVALPPALNMQPNQSETNPAKEEQPEESDSAAVPEPTKAVETTVEEPPQSEPSPPPRTPLRTKTAALATEKLISLSPAVGPSTPVSKKMETSATVPSTPVPGATTKDASGRGQVVTKDEIIKRLQEHQIVLEEQDKAYQDRFAELQKVNEQLNKKIQEKAQGLNQLSLIMKEYEKTISRLVAEKEQEKKAHEEEKENLVKERDSVQGHLNNIEIAFADLHKKYERSKAMIEGFKKNEEVLNAAAAENKANLDKMQSMYDLLKSHAVQKLDTANQELVAIQQRHQQETAKLNAIVKKLEIKSRSLEESLEQKTKENQALAQICDELINSNN